ncbi:hypothetical protein [Mycobacterium phage WXIN]|nr:hypothetical protein [Mycobacterium phage WXIN]
MSDVLIADLADRGEPLAESSQAYSCYLEVDRDERHAVIVWVEPLRFHAEYNGPRKGCYKSGDDDWSPHVDNDGYLNRDARTALGNRLQDYLGARGHVVEPDAYDGSDEPNITFEIVTSYEDGETFSHWHDRIGWPVVGTLINVTDPGTFNSPYLFDMSTLEVCK